MLVTITVALAAVAVLAAIVVVAVGGGGELSTEHPDHPPLSLPARRPAGGTDAALLRLPVGLWGYHKQITDEALERFAYELTERDTRIAVLEQELAEARMRAAETGRQEERGSHALPAAEPPYARGTNEAHDAYDATDAYDTGEGYGDRDAYDGEGYGDRDAYDTGEGYGDREGYDRRAARDAGFPSDPPALPAPRDAETRHVADRDDDGRDQPEPPKTITDEMVYELKTIVSEDRAGGRSGDDDVREGR